MSTPQDPDRHAIVDRLTASGLVAIVRTNSPEGLVEACEALVAGGLEAVEITLTTPGALEGIRAASDRLGDRCLIGVGSVLNPQMAREAMDAGARYVISPIFDPAIIDAAHAADRPAIVGALTPTEVQAATVAGSDLVKVFPANHFGPRYFKDLLAPMPHLKLTPTGGVTLDTVADWLNAGAAALGVGSALVDKQLVAEGRWDELTERATKFVKVVKATRAGMAG
jgi:2-dehydro-3-deoxyphosphogluconate aldolase/(4S)-4-hydroxy-2-oxoglutarate aldolase